MACQITLMSFSGLPAASLFLEETFYSVGSKMNPESLDYTVHKTDKVHVSDFRSRRSVRLLEQSFKRSFC